MDLTMAHVPLRGFNIIPQAAFIPVGGLFAGKPVDEVGVWVATTVIRGEFAEEITSVTGYRADLPADYTGEPIFRTFHFHYCDVVALVGLVVNPNEPDDNDIGNES